MGLKFRYIDNGVNKEKEIKFISSTLQLPHLEGDRVVEIELLPSIDGTISTVLQDMGMGRLVAACDSYVENYGEYLELLNIMVFCTEGELEFPGGYVINCCINNLSPPVLNMDGVYFSIRFKEV